METTSQKCCIPHCIKPQEDPSVSLHEFPTSPDIAAKWIRNINLFLKNGGTWFPQSDSLLCSAHFLPSDFVPTSKKKVLKRKSAPSLFVWHDVKPNKQKYLSKPLPVRSPMIEVLKPKGSEKPLPLVTVSPSHITGKSIKVSKVVSLSDTSNSEQSSPNSFDLPNVKTALASRNIKSTPALFNGQQLLLLPQIPSGSLPPSTGFIIIPEGKPLPNLGKDLVLIPDQKSQMQGNGNVLLLQQQPHLPQVINKNNKDILIQNKTVVNDLKNNLKEEYVYPEIDNENQNDSNVSIVHINTDTLSETQRKAESSVHINEINNKRKIDDKSERTINKKKRSVPTTRKQSSDLIEIAPSTFMKINPDIIRVAKKETPNGNTVLQFIMNPSLMALNNNQPFFSLSQNKPVTVNNSSECNNMVNEKSGIIADPSMEDSSDLNHIPDSTSQNEDSLNNKSDTSGPILASTHLLGSHSFVTARIKYAKALKLKSTQIYRLTAKVKELEQKVEELENKCIVQERQLNFASLKKLKRIKKNADQGDAHAAFILEQIRGYANTNRVVWSDTTLIQCSMWCRKAPYAYEYFKKADLFRLPAMTTIKRFMNRNPEIKLQIKNKVFKKPGDDSSSSSEFDSEFDFDETDNEARGEISISYEEDQGITSDMMDDSQSSMTYIDSHVIHTDTHSALNESSQSANDHSQLLVPNLNKFGAKTAKNKEPLINIFGKILRKSPKHIQQTNEDKLLCTEDEDQLSSNNQEIITPDVESVQNALNTVQVNSEDVSLNKNDLNNPGIVVVSKTCNVEDSTNNPAENSTDQQLVVNIDSSQAENNEDSNRRELIVHQTVLNTEEPGIIGNDDSNTFYVQTSEEDGVTTLKVDGQEIVIPPGTILRFNSDLISSDELGNHFLIIPTSEESATLDNQEYIISDIVSEPAYVTEGINSCVLQTSEVTNDTTAVATTK